MNVGVVIVTFNSEDVIDDCVESLIGSRGCRPHIVIVENSSQDGTLEKLRRFATGGVAYHEVDTETAFTADLPDFGGLTVIKSCVNRGYAGGVNLGLRYLLAFEETELFWVLNPDCRVLPDTAARFVEHAQKSPSFGLMGGRILYVEPENIIQSDGGLVNSSTGMCANLNLGKTVQDVPYPANSHRDFVSGASVVASRRFLEEVGLMEEDYFLYYEEVDWAFRGRDLGMTFAPDAIVFHHAGTSIGSPVVGKKQGSSFSNYFNYRNRLRFIRRFFPGRLPVAYLYSALKVVRLLLQGHFAEADGAFRGLHGLAPPESVRSRLSPEAYRLACMRRNR